MGEKPKTAIDTYLEREMLELCRPLLLRDGYSTRGKPIKMSPWEWIKFWGLRSRWALAEAIRGNMEEMPERRYEARKAFTISPPEFGFKTIQIRRYGNQPEENDDASRQ